MQEKEDFGGICIAFGKGEEVEVVVADVEILASYQRRNIDTNMGLLLRLCLHVRNTVERQNSLLQLH